MTDTLDTRCCVAGGGPAGLMTGFLLARAGVDVVVLEKHKDFFRDFRGDTIHPSTLELMNELGRLEAFLELPHNKAETLSAVFGEDEIQVADFRHLPTRCKFLAIMPQWDFLNFLASEARAYPNFRLLMEAEVDDLLIEDGKIRGVAAQTPSSRLAIRADLTIGADGRSSTVREKAGLVPRDLGAPIDVLWFRLSRKPEDPPATMGRFAAGHLMVQINRGDYWQCAYVIAKGGFDAIKAAGLDSFRQAISSLMPGLAGRPDELQDWDQIKLLTVQVNRLEKWWRPGLLCIGDAAHAMSPIGGVGVNLAVQDAVAAANALVPPLRAGQPLEDAMAAVQARRMWPTRVTQQLQLVIQDRLLKPLLASKELPAPPLPLRIMDHWPVLSRLPARLIGLGVRPEHVQTPDVARSAPGQPALDLQ
ncbi:FAD-dependent oxidoreductase [Rhodoligotrophos defluvii]|uniref:FAD-dependent oxidoreductase n=1 Tax=Rhodoligotrophos defluvii TaxID=2561934 RepID=UPI0010C98A28|nr:FAD-dependent oxidoreductase [Rhodoligotrophos defluvii]